MGFFSPLFSECFAAAALKCLNGEIQGRLKVDTNTASREKAEEMGVDFGRIYFTDDLCPGKQIVFAACGVTSGNLLHGVRHFGHGIRTQSLVLTYRDRKVHFIDTVHMKEGEKVTVTVLDRPRHEQLIADIRKAGARIQLIGDGDLSAAIRAAVSGTGIHAVMGTGGAPEGVLSAAALKCLNGEIQGRLKVDTNTASREKAEEMGVDFGRTYFTDDLCPGKQIVFAACGVTSGNLLHGVRHFGHGIRTQSLVLTYRDRKVHFIDTVHMKEGEKVTVRF